jgi:hypothetical protein
MQKSALTSIGASGSSSDVSAAERISANSLRTSASHSNSEMKLMVAFIFEES